MSTPIQKFIDQTRQAINELGDDQLDTVIKTALKVCVAEARKIQAESEASEQAVADVLSAEVLACTERAEAAHAQLIELANAVYNGEDQAATELARKILGDA